MAPEASGVQLPDRLERCLAAVRARGPGFKPRPSLLPALEALHGLLAAPGGALLGALAALERRAPGSSPLLVALGDAVGACLLLLAALEGQDEDTATVFAPAARQAALWPLAALRIQARRLRVLEAPLRELVAGPGPPTEEPAWDAPAFLECGSAEGLWRRRFGRAAVAPASELLEALAGCCEALGPEEGQELRAWLRPDSAGSVSVTDASLAWGGDGLWRGTLFCTDWAELCPQALIRAILAESGGEAGAAAAAVAPEEREAEEGPEEERGELLLLPGWSRGRLLGERAALHALRALGLRFAADAPEGLLARFPTGHLLWSRPLRAALEEMLGPGAPACRLATPALLEACLAEVAARRLSSSGLRGLAGQRGQHVLLSHAHRRALPWLEDDAEDLLGLQRRHLELLREQLAATVGEEALPELEPSVVDERLDQPSLQDLIQEGRDVAEQILAVQDAQLQADMRLNAEGHEDEDPAPLFLRLEVDAAFAEQEQLLMEEAEVCAWRQGATRAEIAYLERALADLEAAFAASRRDLLQRDRVLSQRIDEAEAELAALSASLAGTREASRATEDDVREAQLELAEQMVLAAPGPECEALEAQLLAEVQGVRQRSEDLQKKLARSRSSTKKR